MQGRHRRLPATLEQLRTAFWLREVNQRGRGSVIDGPPFIRNAGTISLGDNVYLSSHPVQSHLFVSEGGVLDVGKNVVISYGAAISARSQVTIGEGSRIGPFVVIMDSDFHVVGDRTSAGESTPVRIGIGVTIESRVTILKGSTLGNGVRVASGSVVSGVIADGCAVAGVPARQGADLAVAEGELDLPQLIKRVLNLANVPDSSDGPATIGEWDSLGSLKLLLEIERSFAIGIREEQFKAIHCVGDLIELVREARTAQ